MEINFRLSFASSAPRTDEDFEEFVDCVIDELEKIDRDDIEITASLAKRTAVFTEFAEDESSIEEFLAAVRTALHAANCTTKGWETHWSRLVAENRESVGA